MKNQGEELILEYYSQIMNTQGGSSNEDDPELFYNLWHSFLSHKALENLELPKSSLFEQIKPKISLIWLPTKVALNFWKSKVLPLEVTPLPELRSESEEVLHQSGAFLLKSKLFPKVNFHLSIKAQRKGVELRLSAQEKLPSWLVVKLKKGGRLKELQNFAQESVPFFLEKPKGKFSLSLAHCEDKIEESTLVELDFKGLKRK